ncbi:MAG TPA: pantoate--beta-alanine ligase, partial [Candidatus Binataceae bacterium]|nr:pantoate--beta-alanine ligase [Candidatus Binataceae bacterium]
MSSIQVIQHPREMMDFADAARARGERIGFVPTMGFLHEGHLSLMREARRRASIVVASIFVNPTQFGPNEDLSRYPRDFARDCAMTESVPVDVVFGPQPEHMYPARAQTWVEVTEVTRGLCGKGRPGHFRGVTTVVAKLFNLVKPHLAFFGEKDFQQFRAIEQMVADLNFDIEIVPMPIVREVDGLAMSSRNAYLTAEQRRDALALSRAIATARENVSCARTPDDIAQLATKVLSRPGIAIEYVEVVDAETLEPATSLTRPV